jgi:long-chain acyl-CoA synthetase
LERGAACLARGSTEFEGRAKRVKSEDLLTLVYTSGTTGAPKGVQLTHGNVLSNVLGVRDRLPVHPGDVAVSILPTWHMFERILEYVILDRGGCLVYTDARRLRADLTSERPHLMATVPRIWEGLNAAIEEKLAKSSRARRAVFEAAIAAGLTHERARSRRSGLLSILTWPAAALARRAVFDRVREAAGLARLNVCVSGGGSLPRALDELFLAMGIPLLNGYGLTETSPVLCVRRLDDNRAGSVGPPLAETELRIAKDGGGDAPRGEVGVLRVKGPQVTPGYFRDPELTSRAFPEPGWFDTGDLARVDEHGELWIVGRAKDTIALRGGEKIEPERVETALRASPLISQTMLVGQDAKNVAALIVPNAEKLAEALGGASWDGSAGETIDDAAARKLIRQEIDRVVNSENGFRPYERPVRFCLLRRAIDPASGMMTATLKLKRRAISERYASLISELTKD